MFREVVTWFLFTGLSLFLLIFLLGFIKDIKNKDKQSLTSFLFVLMYTAALVVLVYYRYAAFDISIYGLRGIEWLVLIAITMHLLHTVNKILFHKNTLENGFYWMMAAEIIMILATIWNLWEHFYVVLVWAASIIIYSSQRKTGSNERH